MPDVYSKAKRSEIMSRVRNKRTGPEEKVAEILSTLGLRFERNVKTLPGQPDFVVRSRRTVIFVNGCFWHGHDGCNRAKLPQSNPTFWKKKIAFNKRRDARIAKKLRQAGWHVWTIWQCRLRKPDLVAKRLRKLV